jgi:hypothetical protein
MTVFRLVREGTMPNIISYNSFANLKTVSSGYTVSGRTLVSHVCSEIRRRSRRGRERKGKKGTETNVGRSAFTKCFLVFLKKP